MVPPNGPHSPWRRPGALTGSQLTALRQFGVIMGTGMATWGEASGPCCVRR